MKFLKRILTRTEILIGITIIIMTTVRIMDRADMMLAVIFNFIGVVLFVHGLERIIKETKG